MKHFIQQICHASWTPSEHTRHMWLGTWRLQTLRNLLGPHMAAPLSSQKRYEYIKIVKALLAPLLTAYRQMLDINTKSNPKYHKQINNDAFLLFDHEQPQNNDPLPNDPDVIRNAVVQELTNRHSLANIDSINTAEPYAINDTAFFSENAEVSA